MRRDSKVIFGASVMVTAIIIGAAYWYDQRSASANMPSEPINPLVSEPVGEHKDPLDVSAETSFARTHEIIECDDAELGKFYTNAASCEGADLENRLSDYQSLRTPSSGSYTQGSGSSQNRSKARNGSDNGSNLRLTGRSPPSGLPAECKFPVGKALELERPLSAARDPYKSIWREDYCRWRCEARKEQCPVSDDEFGYSYSRICRETQYAYCPIGRSG